MKIMHSSVGVIALVALGTCVGGCYNPNEVEAFLQKPHPAPVSALEYRVYPPDALTITSRHVTEIANLTPQVVRPDGRINLPLLGEIFVAGKTPAEIQGEILEKAKAYYNEVDATVTVTAYNSQKFYVFGQVGIAGPVPWTGHDTLLEALAKAQPTYLAWPERIIVVRGDEPQVGGSTTRMSKEERKDFKSSGIRPPKVDAPRHTMTINMMAMIKYGDYSNNVYLRPNDVVYVQPNPFAEIGLALQSILFPVRPVLEAVRVPATVSGAAP